MKNGNVQWLAKEMSLAGQGYTSVQLNKLHYIADIKAYPGLCVDYLIGLVIISTISNCFALQTIVFATSSSSSSCKLYFVASPDSKQFHSGGTWSFRIALQYFLEGANNNNIKRSPLHMFHFVQLQPLLVKCIIQSATTHILVNTCMHMLPQTLTHHDS
jgi:hypothetical protein